MVADLPRLRPILGAVLAVDGPVGAVVERLHTLHRPGLVGELSARLTAGTPLLHHPPDSTAGSLEGFLPCIKIIPCQAGGHLRGLAALLDIAAFPNGFGLFAGFTKVSMYQAAVTPPPASIFSVLYA